MALPCLFEKLLPPQRPATVHCSTDPAKVHPSLIKAAVQTTARQQACVTASVLVTVCRSQKTTMTSNSTLQHRCCQCASLTDESCCTDNSLTAAFWHCHVCLRSCRPHNDNNSALQHRRCQSAVLTDQSCCPDNRLTAGLCHCKCTRDSMLLTENHNDQQQCTAAQILPKCILH